MKKIFKIFIFSIAILSIQNKIEAVNKEDIKEIPFILTQALIDSISLDGEELQVLEEIVKNARKKISLQNTNTEILAKKLRQELSKTGNLSAIQFFLSWIIHEINMRNVINLIQSKEYKEIEFEEALLKVLEFKFEELNLIIKEYEALNQSI